MSLRFRILGPVEIEGDAGPIEVRGARRRALLIRLLIAGNQPVSADLLAHDIWEGSPPVGASSTLTSHVSLLRGLLGPDRIVNRAGAYCLRVEAGELDAAAFEHELTGGREALRDDRPHQAAELFEGALGRWRGRALADVEGAPWAAGEVARLEELRLGAEESLLDARMALGLHREVVPAAEAAARAEPLREQRWAVWMLALYRSGRQADALRAYQKLHDLLGDELGLEPSSALTGLERAIVLHSPELEWTRPPEVPAAGTGATPSAVSGMVTLLVAELVGEVGEPFRTQLALLRDALVQHDGLEIESRTDGLSAVFTSPSAALASAAAMQQAVERQQRRPGPSTGLRIGLAAGELAVGDGEYVGEVVTEASLLCSSAERGQVLVARVVRAMAGRRCRLGFSDASGARGGEDNEPGSTLSLEWKPLVDEDDAVPVPAVLLLEGPGFVGRATEQATLARALERVAAGERQVVLLGGEPGIGKTALAAVTARSVAKDGGVVLYGRCPEVGAPYQPFVDSLAHYVRYAPRFELEGHVTRFGGELIRLVPSLAHRVPEASPPLSSDPDTERYLAFTAAVGLLADASSRRPVLLILDDLHWADEATIALLRHLVTATVDLPLLVIGTFRSNEITPDHPLADTLAALWRESGVGRLELVGLSPDEVLDLCASMAGHPVDDRESVGFVAELQRDTGGNPFFVWQLLRHLVESGGLVRDDAEHWSPDRRLLRAGLPASLREVIVQRVEHLGPDASKLLSLASVIGVEFDLAALARVSGTDSDRVLDVLELAERSALLEEAGDGGTFAFAHALTRHALYDALGPTRRRLLHARVAAALEEDPAGPPPPAVLAHHFYEGGEPGPALHYAELAGYEAFATVAPDDAALWFGRARTLHETVQPGDDLRRFDLTVRQGVGQLLSGDPQFRRTLLDAVSLAAAAGDARRMAVASLANTRGYYSAAGEIDRERLGALRDSLERLGDDDPQLRVRLLGAVCRETAFESSLAERRVLVTQAKQEAGALDDPVALLTVLNQVFEALRHPDALAERMEDTAVALHLAEDVGDPAALFWAVGNRMQTLLESGAMPEAGQLFERMVAVAAEVGQPVMRWMGVFAGAQWAFLRGESARGELLADEAFAMGQAIGQPDALNYYASQISHARWQQGRLHEIVELIEIGSRDNPGIPGYGAALARALCQAGRHEEARALLDEATDRGFNQLPEDLLWAYGMAAFAEVAIQLDHAGAAEVLYRRLAPFADAFVFVGTACEGPIAHYLGGLAGVLGHYDEADRHLGDAALLADRSGSPFFAVRTAIERGRLAERRGDRALARRLLADAKQSAEHGGFAGECRRAEEALAQLE